MSPRKTSKKAKRLCVRKHRYESRDAALMGMRALQRVDGARMGVFRCPVGAVGEPRHWHVGRRRSRRI